MNFSYIIFSLANIAGFVTAGFLLAYFVKKDWQKLKNVPTKKFIAVATIAALVGGMLGVLVNGMSDFGMSARNIFIACLFALVTIAPYSFSNKLKV